MTGADRQAILDDAIAKAIAVGWRLQTRLDWRAELIGPSGTDVLHLEVQPDGTLHQTQHSGPQPPPPARSSHVAQYLGIGCLALLGLMVAGCVGLAFAGAAAGTFAQYAVRSALSGTSKVTVNGSVGEVLRVGDLDLQVESFGPASLPQGMVEPDQRVIRVGVVATNSRGGNRTYSFTPHFAMKLIDSAGVAHDPYLCIACTNALSPVELAPGGGAHGDVYFQISQSVRPVEMWYQPLLSNNRAVINLRPTQ